jgi:hypothetical protein
VVAVAKTALPLIKGVLYKYTALFKENSYARLNTFQNFFSGQKHVPEFFSEESNEGIHSVADSAVH